MGSPKKSGFYRFAVQVRVPFDSLGRPIAMNTWKQPMKKKQNEGFFLEGGLCFFVFFSSAVFILYAFCHNINYRFSIYSALKVAACLEDHFGPFAAFPLSQANCCSISIVFLRRK